MSDLQSAIAGLNTVDIEGDPIDALDACLMVLELLEKPETVPDTQPVTPKYEFTEKVTPAARQRANNEAIAILRSLQGGEIDRLTDDQKAKLSRYTGTGGNLVGEDGLKGSAYEYYTPLPVAQSMWDLLKEQGFAGGSVLDPSSGTGIFAASAPDGILMQSVELSDISGNINKLVNGSSKHAVTVSPFEAVAASTQDEIYDAVVTNVPFGTNADRGANKVLDTKYQKDTLEEYFIKRSLDKLRPNGFAAFIVPTKVLDNATFKKFRQAILLRADLVGAYRLPNKVFDATGADVTTDIIVLKKFSGEVSEKIANLYENGGLSTLQDARVLDADIVGGRYFKTYGKQFVLGETVKAKGQFGEVEKVVNDDSLPNILKLIKRFPDSRIDYDLLQVTPEKDAVMFNDGDIRLVDGATFERKNGTWVQVFDSVTVEPDFAKFKTAYAMLEAGVTPEELNQYFGFIGARGQRAPVWINELKTEIDKKPKNLGFWLCMLSVVDALKTKNTMAYAEKYPVLTSQMIGYAQDLLSGKVKTDNSAYKRTLVTAGIAFDGNMPDSISQYWRGMDDQDIGDTQLSKHAAYENAIYRGIAKDWQVDVSVIQSENPDFDPMADPDYCINEDGSKVTLKRDYYVGNYGDFLQKIDAQIQAAADPLIKEKLIHQKLNAAKMIKPIDVSKLQYGLMSTVIPMDMKYRYFSEFVEDKVVLDADDRLVIDEKLDSVYDLIKYRLRNSPAMQTGKMDESIKALRYFMLNRVFNSINNNQRLSIKAGDDVKSADKAQLLKMLVSYYSDLNTSFDAWLKSNQEYMDALDRQFNAPENKTFPIQLDESPIDIEGFQPKKEGFVSLNGYQNSEIRRLSRKFSGICGFDVGLGKTLTALAAVQNMHNIGVKKRTFFIVPSHTISKWYGDMKMAYDNVDDVLVIGSNQGQQSAVDSKYNAVDFALLTKPEGKQYRKILMTVDAFNMIPLREKTIEDHFNQVEGDWAGTDKKRDFEKLAGTLTTRTKKINKYEGKLAYFEDMAVDSLVFDEAQLFKNGKAGGGQFDRIKGLSLLSENTLSARAVSAAIKSWYVRGQSGEMQDGVLLLTATPFTNSPVEILTMLSLSVGDDQAMKQLGGASIKNVDDFLSTFASVEPLEQTNIVGDDVSVDTFVGFANAQLLKDAIHAVANIKTAKDGGLKIPDEETENVEIDLSASDKETLSQMKAAYGMAKQAIKGGGIMADESQMAWYENFKAMTGESDELLAHPFNLIGKMSDVILAGSEMGLMRVVPIDFNPDQLELAQSIADEFNKKDVTIKTERRYPSVDDDLMTVKMVADADGEQSPQYTVKCRVTLDDQRSRLILNVDDAGVVAQLMTAIDKGKLTVQPKLSSKVQAMVENFKAEMTTPRHEGHAKQLIFCDNLAMQHLIKRALIAYCGVAPSKIAIINAQTLPDGTKGSPDTEHMQEVQDKFADNIFTVVIANKKAETGIDLQKGTQAIHHLTTGWTPDSIQQRNGRGIRQGNKQEKVTVYHYNANGTFDEYKQRLIAGKSDWIDQLMQNGGEITGTLNVTKELTREDYEDLINADSPEQIAALMQAKADREELQRKTVVAARTKLLYDNVMKARNRPRPTVLSEVYKIMDADADRMFEWLKKARKATAKPELAEKYRENAKIIAGKYNGWFDGNLTAELVLSSISSVASYDIRGRKGERRDIYQHMVQPVRREDLGINFKRDQIEPWIEANLNMINDVFNRARNIVNTAENMTESTAKSFLNYKDNDFSDDERQALLDGAAALDLNGELWMAGDYCKAEGTRGAVTGVTVYGYVKIVEAKTVGHMVEFKIATMTKSTPQKVQPAEKAAAIEYMVEFDMYLMENRQKFDIDASWLYYSPALADIRTIVADRMSGAAAEWGEKLTTVDYSSLYHKPTDRMYWRPKGLLQDLVEAHPDIASKYNSVFEIEPDSENAIRTSCAIKNKNMKNYEILRNAAPMGGHSKFFAEYLAPFLEANSLKVTMSLASYEAAIAPMQTITSVFQQMELMDAEAASGTKAITVEEAMQLLEKAFNFAALLDVVSNVNEVFLWWLASEKGVKTKARLKIMSADGTVSDGLVETARSVAIVNNKGTSVIGLKSTVNGKSGNVLFDNKQSLKNTSRYAYWSGRQGMWIIDLASFEKVSELSWYDQTKINIVEAVY